MAHHQPFEVLGFHGCDKKVAMSVVCGEMELRPSNNSWDWLGGGIYFWEQNPQRALNYSEEVAKRSQLNRIPITTPFVLGALIELGNCLNLMAPQSLLILQKAYAILASNCQETGLTLPENKGDNRALDCAVINYLHESMNAAGAASYDTIRCAFIEGPAVYPGASFSTRGHIQVCVRNNEAIKAYFLPRPVAYFNPYLKKHFVPSEN